MVAEEAAKALAVAATKVSAKTRAAMEALTQRLSAVPKLGPDVGPSSKGSSKNPSRSSSSKSASSSSESRPDSGSDEEDSCDGDEGLLEAAQDNFFAQAFMSVLRQPEMYRDVLGEDEPPTSFQPPTNEELMWNLAEVLVKAKLRADQRQQ